MRFKILANSLKLKIHAGEKVLQNSTLVNVSNNTLK